MRLPGGLKVGWDGILGLIPGFGDLATTILSLYILGRAARLGCSPSVLVRMACNIAFDSFLDVVPVLGQITDFFFRSNLRNLRLVDDFLENPKAVSRSSRLWIGLTMLGLSLGFVALGAVLLLAFRAGWQWVVGLF